MTYAAKPGESFGVASQKPPSSKCPTSPSEVNGRTKKDVSETVFPRPRLAYGVNELKAWLTVLVQSTVTWPVLNPRDSSPVGAENSSDEPKSAASCSATN